MTPKNRFSIFLSLAALTAAFCLAGCSAEKQYTAGGDASGKTPAASAAPAAAPDNGRAKPGSDDAGGK